MRALGVLLIILPRSAAAVLCLNGTLGSSPTSGVALCCDRRCKTCATSGCSKGTINNHAAGLLCCETAILRRRRREYLKTRRAHGQRIVNPEACRTEYDAACILVNQSFNGSHILPFDADARQLRKRIAEEESRNRTRAKAQKQADDHIRRTLGLAKSTLGVHKTPEAAARGGKATTGSSAQAPPVETKMSWMPFYPKSSPEAAMATAVEQMAGFVVLEGGSPDSWRARFAEILMRLKGDLASAERAKGCHPDPLSVAAHSECPSSNWHDQIAHLLAAPEMVREAQCISHYALSHYSHILLSQHMHRYEPYALSTHLDHSLRCVRAAGAAQCRREQGL